MILHDTVDKMYVAVAKELKQNSNMIESRNGDTYEIHPHFYGSSDFRCGGRICNVHESK